MIRCASPVSRGRNHRLSHLQINIRILLNHALKERNIVNRIFKLSVDSAQRRLHRRNAGLSRHIDHRFGERQCVLQRWTEIGVKNDSIRVKSGGLRRYASRSFRRVQFGRPEAPPPILLRSFPAGSFGDPFRSRKARLRAFDPLLRPISCLLLFLSSAPLRASSTGPDPRNSACCASFNSRSAALRRRFRAAIPDRPSPRHVCFCRDVGFCGNGIRLEFEFPIAPIGPPQHLSRISQRLLHRYRVGRSRAKPLANSLPLAPQASSAAFCDGAATMAS